MKADLFKLRKSSLPWIHIIAPVGLATIFLLYYAISNWNPVSKVVGYYNILGMCFPIIIGLLTAMISDIELRAGNYQNMLMAPSRIKAFFSKAIILWLGGVFSISLASLLFGAGNIYLLKQSEYGFAFYIKAAVISLIASVIMYLLHLYLAFRFQKGITIIAGIIEGLLAMLLRTSLGDNCWVFIPCSWAPRIVHYKCIYQQEGMWLDDRIWIALVTCVALSVVSMVLFGAWATKWEGAHTEE